MKSKNKKKDKIVNFILELQTEDEQETILIDGHEGAFVGYTRTKDGISAVYSFDKIIDDLIEDGMTYDEADEFFCYNIERGIDYITGAVKPIILYPYKNNS
jgi:hypothetical protein